MDITGTIIAAYPIVSGVSQRTGKEWQSQEYVIQTNGEEYAKRCCFKVFGEERIKSLNLAEGLIGTAYLDVDAHEYNGRWYNTVTCWKFVPSRPAEAPAGEGAESEGDEFFPPPVNEAEKVDTDDLPF